MLRQIKEEQFASQSSLPKIEETEEHDEIDDQDYPMFPIQKQDKATIES